MSRGNLASAVDIEVRNLTSYERGGGGEGRGEGFKISRGVLFTVVT